MRKHSRKEQERLNRRAWILDSSEELMCQYGVMCVGMEQIAQHAECAKGTLYQHFTSKEHIILALAERDLSQLLGNTERATAGIRSPLHRVIAVFETLVQHRQSAPISYTHHVQAMLEDDRPEHKADPATRASLERLHNSIRSTVVTLVHEAAMLGEIKHDVTPESDLKDGLIALVDLVLFGPVYQHRDSKQHHCPHNGCHNLDNTPRPLPYRLACSRVDEETEPLPAEAERRHPDRQ